MSLVSIFNSQSSIPVAEPFSAVLIVLQSSINNLQFSIDLSSNKYPVSCKQQRETSNKYPASSN